MNNNNNNNNNSGSSKDRKSVRKGGGNNNGGRDTNTEKPSTPGRKEKQQQNGSNGADGKIELRALLANNKNSEFCAPRSFDWNETNVNRIGTSSIDTTCTVWDIEESADTQLIYTTKKHDIAWGGPDVSRPPPPMVQ